MGQGRTHDGLGTRLGHPFADPRLRDQALTPPSAGLAEDNQRLEFLGDAVLQLCISRLIYRLHPDWREGAMSKLRGMLVCTDSLRAWAEDLGVELRRGPRTPRRAAEASLRGKPLADAVEALLAAVYLDEEAQGRAGLAAAEAVVARRFEAQVRDAYEGVWAERDSKTTLQELAAARNLPAPAYTLEGRSGPDHAPRFKARVTVGGIEATGEAGTLKAAQTEAALAALRHLRETPH